jgi:hypothetical protein
MISIHDDPETVKRKISKAYCPEKQVDGNPVRIGYVRSWTSNGNNEKYAGWYSYS